MAMPTKFPWDWAAPVHEKDKDPLVYLHGYYDGRRDFLGAMPFNSLRDDGVTALLPCVIL